MKSLDHQNPSQPSPRGPSYFERNFALIAGRFVPPQLCQSTYPQYIALRSGSELLRINVNNINSIEAAGDYMCFNCKDDKVHVVRKTMKQLEDEFDPSQFIRIHRSSMVNKAKISHVTCDSNGETIVVLQGGQTLKVSRRFKSKIAPQIRSYMYN